MSPEKKSHLHSRREEHAPYGLSRTSPEDLENLFSYHKPNTEEQERIKLLRQKFIDTGLTVLDHCGNSVESNLAITQLHLALQAAITALVVHYAPAVKE